MRGRITQVWRQAAPHPPQRDHWGTFPHRGKAFGRRYFREVLDSGRILHPPLWPNGKPNRAHRASAQQPRRRHQLSAPAAAAPSAAEGAEIEAAQIGQLPRSSTARSMRLQFFSSAKVRRTVDGVPVANQTDSHDPRTHEQADPFPGPPVRPGAFSFGPAAARFLFGKTKRKWGAESPGNLPAPPEGRIPRGDPAPPEGKGFEKLAGGVLCAGRCRLAKSASPRFVQTPRRRP